MFKAALPVPILKEVLKVLCTITDVVNLEITAKDINVRTVDTGHAAMMAMTLGKGAFTSYKAKKCILAMDVEEVKRFVSLGNEKQEALLEHDEEHNKMVIEMGTLKRTFRLLDVDESLSPKLPKLTHKATSGVARELLVDGFKAAAWVANHVYFNADEKGLIMSAGDIMDTIELKLPEGELETHECKEPVRSKFQLNYLEDAVKTMPKLAIVNVHLGEQYPIVMDFKFALGHGEATHLIAPVIETED